MALSDKAWVVTAEYVTVPTMTPDGKRIVGRYKDSPLPPDVPEHILAHLLDKDMIGEAPPGVVPRQSTGSVEEQGAPGDPGDDEPQAPPPKPAEAAPPPRGGTAGRGKPREG
jgi:hypothetical protein